MKKYDIAEIFTDIDDEFIAGAKPMALKPIVLKPEPRSKSAVWKKCAAAAACLAVVAGAGGVFAIKAINSSQTSNPLDSVNLSNSEKAQPNLPWIDLDTFYDSIQGIGKHLSHIDSMIYDSNDELVKFNIVNSVQTDEMRFFIGIDQDEYGLGDYITVVAALENTSDKVIGVLTPFSRDAENGYYYNLTGTHSEITVDLKNGDWSLFDSNEEKFFLDDPHILAIKPGETYYQAMSFNTRYELLSGELADVPTGTYNGSASVKVVSDEGNISVQSLDFNVNIADWRACTDWFANNGMIDEVEINHEYLYTKDGIYYNNYRKLTKLYGGEYVQDFYRYDLNGDKVLEYISTVTVNSEIGDLIYAYDVVNKQIYVSKGFGEYNFRLDRVNGRPMVRKFDKNGAEISVEPLKFDMLTPCIFDDNGEPMLLSADSEDDPRLDFPDNSFGGHDDDNGFSYDQKQ